MPYSQGVTSRTAVRVSTSVQTFQAAWWQWLTILSLDAPIVCLLWQRLLARTAGVNLTQANAFVLVASVWLAYAADRSIEGWRLDRRSIRTQRHSFYQRWRWPVLAAWVTVFAIDMGVALARIDRDHLIRGSLLLCAVLAYLLSHQLVHRHRSWRAPKEVIVALLLTAGVALFLVSLPVSSTLLVGLAAFSLACFANCALISLWERDVDLAQGQTSLALTFAHNPRLIRWLPWAAAGLGLIMLPWVPRSARMSVSCGTASALLLAGVDHFEPYIGRAAARVLADIVLMTPMVALTWGA